MVRFATVFWALFMALTAPLPAGTCTDIDGDGFCVADDCNDTDPNCNLDCTDADGDGFCPPHDCDDSLPHVGDVDGDSVPDACDNCPTVFNRDQYDFEGFGHEPPISTMAFFGMSIVAADLDGDLDLDVVAVANGQGANVWVAWFENLDGAGNFGPQRTITDALGWQVVTADFDDDMDLDVMVTFPAEDATRWYRNDGAGNFTLADSILGPEFSAPQFLHAVDLDGDTDIDVISERDFSQPTTLPQIVWHENLNDTGFQTHVISHTSANFVFSADLDGDLDSDGPPSSAPISRSWAT